MVDIKQVFRFNRVHINEVHINEVHAHEGMLTTTVVQPCAAVSTLMSTCIILSCTMPQALCRGFTTYYSFAIPWPCGLAFSANVGKELKWN